MAKPSLKKRVRRSAKQLGAKQIPTMSVRPLRFRADKTARALEWPDEPEGGAGVREPRRPVPGAPSGAMALDLPHDELADIAH